MEKWRKDARREAVIVDLDMLVPKNHLLRKIEKVMDYDWLYERLEGYYCHTNGRPGTDPVVLIKMVLLQHLFGIPSLRQTYREVQVNLAYRWFLGYGLLEEIPHFAKVVGWVLLRSAQRRSGILAALADIIEHTRAGSLAHAPLAGYCAGYRCF